MVIKVENLDQLMLDFKESSISDNVKYSDFNEILKLVKERVIEEWDENKVSAAFTIPYKEDVVGNFYMDGDCIFILRKFERGDKDDNDINYTYEYNGTIS